MDTSPERTVRPLLTGVLPDDRNRLVVGVVEAGRDDDAVVADGTEFRLGSQHLLFKEQRM